MKKIFTLGATMAMSLAATLSASAYDAVALTFNRTGGDAQSVTVSVTDPATGAAIPGVTASLASASHAFKTSGSAVTAALLCPDVNGSSSPSIELQFTITGLSSEFKASSMSLDIHALNASGAYQTNSDHKARKFNVAAKLGNSPFATLSDIDIADGVGSATAVHKTWTMDAASAVAASSPLNVTLSVTKGSENLGCFFGLSSLTLTAGSGSTVTPPDPVTPPTPADPSTHAIAKGIYNIIWKSNTSSYMTERAGGSLCISSYSVNTACFWEVTPVEGKDNVYTIRNTATGNYIGSCNFTPSSASKISSSASPVEYYIGKTAATSGDNANCCWFSSTDCANYSDESKGPRALNKDGASDNVITWTAVVGNVGSYWRLAPATEEYTPFSIAPAIGRQTVTYALVAPDGQAWNGSVWTRLNHTDATQGFYFVAAGSGRVQIVSVDGNAPINGGASYAVKGGGELYSFTLPDGSSLSLGGKTAFKVVTRRTPFALAARIYSMPCGSVGSVYITRAELTGCITPLEYPLATLSNGTVSHPSASKPGANYTMFTRSRATLAAGTKASLDLTLNQALPQGSTLTAYADWDRDGLFETTIPLAVNGSSASASISVPHDAASGSSRLRLRLTDNGLTGADDETHGQTLDLIVNTVAEVPTPVLTVKSADATRGFASTDGVTATATPRGTALFISWTEGLNLVSIEPSFTPALTRPMALTANFTPNLEDIFGGIVSAETDPSLTITLDGSTIVAPGASSIALFSVTGAIAARSSGDRLDASALAPGVYVAVAISPRGTASAKLRL
ncbi:MAG: GEVED domain-containing protein [Pseudoflavonifractor sp.]|nr:GEVED domain-containing protein [Alloprevotella sp.]MCM1117526.1 GEVED domain-containing protein [Pseudoflavonifractor sp.]